jgi:dihydroorotate dehydrogenase (fumarate)/dihydroorotate dehydrogenase
VALYSDILRPLLFRLDPERAHRLALQASHHLEWAQGLLRACTAVRDERLRADICNLRFDTPIGLAAGFDKSADALATLAALGFGFVEVGSVSRFASKGNPRPRLFRLPADKAVVVAYGVPNDGADIVASRLVRSHLCVPLGVNIVKTNHGRGAKPETADEIIADYVEATRILAPVADYLMFNLSCPNTEDGRDFFADNARLAAWLDAIGALNLRIPVFLKVSPLGGITMIEQLLAAVDKHGYISGFSFNLPSEKPKGLVTPEAEWRHLPGAVSGPPSAHLLDFCLRECYRRMDRTRYVLISSGGVATGEDAYAKIRNGASLVQLLTALIYEGPSVVRRVTKSLASALERDGFKTIRDAIGAAAR